METLLYLLLAFIAGFVSIMYFSEAGMTTALIFLLTGFALCGASAFTALYSKWWGEKGGQMATIVLRNLTGIPLWFIGALLAWLAPSPFLFSPDIKVKLFAWFLIIAGSIPFILGHIEIGMPTHMPSVKDKLVRAGLYAYVRHPIYAGGILIIIGSALLKPTSFFVLACILAFGWLIIQARLEEMDLLQRMPDYKEYMKQVPRFIPRFRQGK